MIVKFLGFVMLFFAAAALGFFAAFKSESELKNLEFFITKITELRDRILYDGSEIGVLINKIFGDTKMLKVENGRFIISDCLLGSGERKVLYEFFSKLGSTERQGEISRAEFCLSALKESSKRLSVQTREKSHLYRILGVCCGILICIIFI